MTPCRGETTFFPATPSPWSQTLGSDLWLFELTRRPSMPPTSVLCFQNNRDTRKLSGVSNADFYCMFVKNILVFIVPKISWTLTPLAHKPQPQPPVFRSMSNSFFISVDGTHFGRSAAAERSRRWPAPLFILFQFCQVWPLTHFFFFLFVNHHWFVRRGNQWPLVGETHCAFVKHPFLHRSLFVKSQQNRIESVTRPKFCQVPEAGQQFGGGHGTKLKHLIQSSGLLSPPHLWYTYTRAQEPNRPRVVQSLNSQRL